MKRLLASAALLVVLAGCNPVAYVPGPIPAAPRSAGVQVGGGVNPLAAQGVAAITVAPVAGVGVTGRVLYSNTDLLFGGDGAGSYAHRGADLGVTGALPLSPAVSVEAGVAAGRDWVDTTVGSYDIGCCSQTFRPLDVTTERVSGHLGLWLGVDAGLGPAVRLTRARSWTNDAANADTGVFIEPVLRGREQRGAFELSAQVGFSVPVGGSYRDRFAGVPYVGGVGVAYQFGR